MHEILHAYDKFTHASHLQITKSVELQREKIKGQDYELVLIALKSQQKFSIVLQKKITKMWQNYTQNTAENTTKISLILIRNTKNLKNTSK